MNAKNGLWLALAGLLVGHYVYLHDLVMGGKTVWMGPISWTVAVVALVVSLAGLWMIWRDGEDQTE